MKSDTKEVCNSGSSDDEPLSLIKSSLHRTEAKKYADYILQRNDSLKRKAKNEAVEQLKAERKQLEGCWQKRRHSLEVEHKRGLETLEEKRKERARQVEAEEKEKLEVERRERECLEAAKSQMYRHFCNLNVAFLFLFWHFGILALL